MQRLLEKTILLNVLATMKTGCLQDERKQMLLLLEPLKNQELQKLGTIATGFRQVFTTLYHSIYGLDAEENHTTGEILSFDKINVALRKTGLGL